VRSAITMIYAEDLVQVARRVIWFGSPEQALEIPNYFLTYLMNHGSEPDLKTASKYYSDEDFQAALDHPAPGIFSPEAWVRWNVRYGRLPIPPYPSGASPGSIQIQFLTCFIPRLPLPNHQNSCRLIVRLF
jgi:hypothetical protein